jgi:ferritin
MIQPEVVELLQAQFTLKRTNEQYYKALASAADVADRHGAKAFFKKQADDEKCHAKRIQDYLVDQDENPVYDALEAIPALDGTVYLTMFEAALKREKITTEALNALWEAADPQTTAFIQNSGKHWPGFLLEQVEEEEQLDDYIARIEPLDATGIELFDKQLKRKYK